MDAWGVPSLPKPACLIFSRLETAVHRWAKKELDCDTHGRAGLDLAEVRPPQDVILRHIHTDGQCPTLATGRSNHPLFTEDRTFFSTRTLCSLFGLPTSDALSKALLAMPAGRAQQALCRGVSMYTTCPLVAMLSREPSSPLYGVADWRVALAFTGADVFSAAMRITGQGYTLLRASEPDQFCRNVVTAVHPLLLEAGRFPTDAASPEATTFSEPADLAFWGFPCVLYSGLNRGPSAVALERSLAVFDRALDYVRLHRPRVFLLENVPSLLGRYRWVLDRILSMLADLNYAKWYGGVLSALDNGSSASRSRLFLMGWHPQ